MIDSADPRIADHRLSPLNMPITSNTMLMTNTIVAMVRAVGLPPQADTDRERDGADHQAYPSDDGGPRDELRRDDHDDRADDLQKARQPRDDRDEGHPEWTLRHVNVLRVVEHGCFGHNVAAALVGGIAQLEAVGRATYSVALGRREGKLRWRTEGTGIRSWRRSRDRRGRGA